MLDINIRVITFAANHPACYISLRFFMEAWKLNSGPYYEKTRFTIMLPEQPSAECLNVCNELAAHYPADLLQVSAQANADYRYYWPMSFLDHEFAEDLLIYCPPQTLVSGNLSELLEQSHLEQKIVAPAFIQHATLAPRLLSALQNAGVEKADDVLSTWFAAFPKSVRPKLSNCFATTLAQLGFPERNPPTYHDVMGLLASAFTYLLHEKNLGYRIADPEIFHELCAEDTHSTIDFDQQALFAITDDAAAAFTWDGVFHSIETVQTFLDESNVSGAWLYYQRNLRRIQNALQLTQFSKRDLFQSRRNPYYIFAMDYIQQSAGIRALHYLCHALNESGQEAYVTCEGTSHHLRTNVLTEKIMIQHHDTGRVPIMVYPETVPGNPFKAQVVARWLLNKPGLIGGETAYDATELLFTFDPLYLVDGMHGETLHVPTSDLRLFNNENNPEDDKRTSVCFYAHKYLYSGGKLTPHVKNATSLGKENILGHAEIAAILRRSKLLYVYEPTALIEEALLCGCPVAVIKTDYWRNNMPGFSYPADYGIAMGDSAQALAVARSTVHNYRDLYESTVLKNAWKQIDHFIYLTQKAASKKRVFC
ncbi:MAG: hypothetical protein ABII63_01150 [Pseudomonadota bacterium]